MATIPGQLPYSNPENIISAAPGSVFFRDGDKFYIEINGTLTAINNVNKKSFAIHYKDLPQLEYFNEELITFSKPRERWIKTGTTTGKTGWKYLNDKDSFSFATTVTPTPTVTVTVTPSTTPTPTPSPSP